MLFFVDFENVRDVDLSALPPECKVNIFVGKSQNSIPFSLTSTAQHFGDRLQWVKIEGDGKNNLDFHLAFYLGKLAGKFPAEEFVILSKDKGFDALICHLVQRNIKCRRLNTLAELAPILVSPEDLHYARALDVLSKIEKKSRPRKRKTLTQFVTSIFQKKLPVKENERIVEQLFSNRLISESNNTLSYDF